MSYPPGNFEEYEIDRFRPYDPMWILPEESFQEESPQDLQSSVSFRALFHRRLASLRSKVYRILAAMPSIKHHRTRRLPPSPSLTGSACSSSNCMGQSSDSMDDGGLAYRRGSMSPLHLPQSVAASVAPNSTRESAEEPESKIKGVLRPFVRSLHAGKGPHIRQFLFGQGRLSHVYDNRDGQDSLPDRANVVSWTQEFAPLPPVKTGANFTTSVSARLAPDHLHLSQDHLANSAQVQSRQLKGSPSPTLQQRHRSILERGRPPRLRKSNRDNSRASVNSTPEMSSICIAERRCEARCEPDDDMSDCGTFPDRDLPIFASSQDTTSPDTRDGKSCSAIEDKEGVMPDEKSPMPSPAKSSPSSDGRRSRLNRLAKKALNLTPTKIRKMAAGPREFRQLSSVDSLHQNLEEPLELLPSASGRVDGIEQEGQSRSHHSSPAKQRVTLGDFLGVLGARSNSSGKSSQASQWSGGNLGQKSAEVTLARVKPLEPSTSLHPDALSRPDIEITSATSIASVDEREQYTEADNRPTSIYENAVDDASSIEDIHSLRAYGSACSRPSSRNPSPFDDSDCSDEASDATRRPAASMVSAIEEESSSDECFAMHPSSDDRTEDYSSIDVCEHLLMRAKASREARA